jgi:hypothetical protein
MSTTDHVKNFKALVSIVKTYGGAYGCKPGLLRAQLIKQGVSASDLDAPDLTDLKMAEEFFCKNISCACSFGERTKAGAQS